VDRRFPATVGRAYAAAHPAAAEPAATLIAPRSGYVQTIAVDSQLRCAREADIVIRIELVPGEFTVSGAVFARAYPAARVNERLCKVVKRAIAIGRNRVLAQDPAFALRQLADMAIKALSPAINDPTTAVACIDRLSDLLRRIAAQPDPAPGRCDESGRLRLILPVRSFAELLDEAYAQIRHYGESHAAVLARLLGALQRIGESAREERRAVLLGHVNCIAERIERGRFDYRERELLRRRLDAARAACVASENSGGAAA
jgi:uncharacterized membrane protein